MMRYFSFYSSILILTFVLFIPTEYSYGQPRKVLKLNDGWQFMLADRQIEEISLFDTSWQDVVIPHTWNNKDIQSGEEVHYGTGWYKKEMNVENSPSGTQYFLRFDGVGQYAEVYVNNKYVGEHLGSYSAFVFNITNFIEKEKVNTILVKVNNELNNSYPKDNFLFGIYGGIYRDVSLITTSDVHVALSDHASSGVYIEQEKVGIENAELKITCLLKNEVSYKRQLIVMHILYSKEHNKVAEIDQDTLIYPGGLISVETTLNIKNPHLWDGKKDPYLYTIKTQLIEDGELRDEVIQAIGIRSCSIDPEKGFMLNSEPYRLYGVCRHQEWKDLGNALLPKHHKKDMELINELGATSIRLAHYQQAEYIYDLADSMGILVWAEIPFVNGYNENADANALQQLTELIKQNYNHPSIFVWGLHNEVIKGDVIQPAVNLTNVLHNLAKTLDPQRYTVSVSNIWWVFDHPIHELTDLQGYNQYTGWYGGKPTELGKWINNYHTKKPDVRFSISEYGAGGNIAHQTNDILSVPDPKGQFFPETYQTYYHEETWAAIEKAPFIWASYIWNMFDFSVPEWDRGGVKGLNHKGLVTYDRTTKKDAFYWYKANWSEEPVLYFAGRRNNTSDTTVCRFKAYCNFGVPELFINGKSYGLLKKEINDVHFVSDEISLQKGQNIIEIKAQYKDEEMRDTFFIEVSE
ncbi:MAG: beta-galactosidase [Bacteroidales bacterium]|nr:beta-galactosidase [Bacteroidales bacterium]MCF8455353.1 beta-galactosidase [Bacteroidales bacterium]